MEQEIRNADLSDMMCDLLYLLGCGVNEKMPAKAYIKTFQEAYDEDKMQMMYRFSKAHFVEALTGTVLKKARKNITANLILHILPFRLYNIGFNYIISADLINRRFDK